ncbi:MAG: helix-turn-helix transcriptional regulator [Lachnospiraceae bacterium]|nr:helix-turn-helix transcriptional regulator [Lachnospiraceae bacterium]
MISYEPFWNTLKKSSESTYTLINKHNISSATIDKLRHGKPLTTTTLNDLCRVLRCRIENIVEYVESPLDQHL